MDHAGTLTRGNDRFPAIILWPPDAPMAATNKCLAQSNKSRTGAKRLRSGTPNEQVQRERRGQFQGSSIMHGNTTTFYDRSGHYTGSVTPQGTASNPLTGGRR
jgi:hypothetical protein